MIKRIYYNTMVRWLEAYKQHLLKSKSEQGVESQYQVIEKFIQFVCHTHLVSGIDQITVSMANSKFHAEYSRSAKNGIEKDKLKRILKDYFAFVFQRYGIKNDKLLKGLDKK